MVRWLEIVLLSRFKIDMANGRASRAGYDTKTVLEKPSSRP